MVSVVAVGMWGAGASAWSTLVVVEGGSVVVVDKGLERSGVVSRRIPSFAEVGVGVAGPEVVLGVARGLEVLDALD